MNALDSFEIFVSPKHTRDSSRAYRPHTHGPEGLLDEGVRTQRCQRPIRFGAPKRNQSKEESEHGNYSGVR